MIHLLILPPPGSKTSVKMKIIKNAADTFYGICGA